MIELSSFLNPGFTEKVAGVLSSTTSLSKGLSPSKDFHVHTRVTPNLDQQMLYSREQVKPISDQANALNTKVKIETSADLKDPAIEKRRIFKFRK